MISCAVIRIVSFLFSPFLPSLSLVEGLGVRPLFKSDCSGFPASGLRRLESGGALANVSTNAYNWSSSSYGLGDLANRGAFLNLNSTWVNPLNNTNRTHGFPVRCVQELAKVSLF